MLPPSKLRQILLAIAIIISAAPFASGFGGGRGGPGPRGFGPPNFGAAAPDVVDAATLQTQMASTDEEWMVLWPKLQNILLLRDEVHPASTNPFAGGFMMGGPGGMPMGGSGLEAPNNLGMGTSGVGMANQADPFNPQKIPGLPKPQPGFFGAILGQAGFAMPAPNGSMFTVPKGNAVQTQLTELATMLRDKTTTNDQLKEKLTLIRATRQKAKAELQTAQADFMHLITPAQAALLLASGYLD